MSGFMGPGIVWCCDNGEGSRADIVFEQASDERVAVLDAETTEAFTVIE